MLSAQRAVLAALISFPVAMALPAADLDSTSRPTVLRKASNVGPSVVGPAFVLTLTGVDSYVGVAASAGSGVGGTAAGDLFLRGNQKLLISTNGGTSAALTVDASGNVTAAGSVAAPSFVGSVSSATNFTGNLAGDVTGFQGATQVAMVGGVSAANVATGAQAANAATSANTVNTIARRDSSGKLAVSAIEFADGTVLTSASMRKYYLANANANGAQASTACAAGFHMASIWELLNPSALSYDTTRGIVYADSGSGPPRESGWIRTGYASRNGNQAGLGNCYAWTSNLNTDYGTAASLPSPDWNFNPQTVTYGTYIAPWQASSPACNTTRPVWCIQD